jgi:4-hydroxy-tetrahydrodipicolinate synthase
MSIFKGAGVAIVTPFNADESVNFDKLGELIEAQILGGTDAIIVCGTTGEASTLSHEEHLEVIHYCTSKVNKRVPVIAGTGSNATATAIYLSVEAQKAGADAVLLMSPYYNKATQKGLYEHFARTAHAIDIPVVLYNIPGRTSINIKPDTIASLIRDVDNIVAVKEATGDISQMLDTVSKCEGRVDLYAGNDNQIVPALSIGGLGVISVLSNIAPGPTHEITAAWFAGDTKKSLDLQLKYLPLIDALFCEVNPIPVKAALNLMGYNVGQMRLPLTPMESANEALLASELRKVGLLK